MKNETVIAAIFSEGRKKILLVKRRDVPVWVLPGGGIDAGEKPDEACLREAEEETGFKVEIVKKVGLYLPINKLSKKTHLFECSILSGAPTISSECQEVSFFDLDKLPKLLPPPHDEWIIDAHKNLQEMVSRKLERVNYRTLLINLIKHPLLVSRFLLTKVGIRINS